MKVEISKTEKTIATALLVLVLFGLIIWQQFQLTELRNELKFAQNFTAIVNQLNQNTNDIKAIAQIIQKNLTENQSLREQKK